MINPDELYELYGDFQAEAEFEFNNEGECVLWNNVNTEFLKWLAGENKVRGRRVESGTFEDFRRLLSADS